MFMMIPGSLTVVRTVWPCSSNDLMRYPAMNPVPPVTQYSGIFTTLGLLILAVCTYLLFDRKRLDLGSYFYSFRWNSVFS